MYKSIYVNKMEEWNQNISFRVKFLKYVETASNWKYLKICPVHILLRPTAFSSKCALKGDRGSQETYIFNLRMIYLPCTCTL